MNSLFGEDCRMKQQYGITDKGCNLPTGNAVQIPSTTDGEHICDIYTKGLCVYTNSRHFQIILGIIHPHTATRAMESGVVCRESTLHLSITYVNEDKGNDL